MEFSMTEYKILVTGGLLLDPAMKKVLERKDVPKKGETTPVNTNYLSASFVSPKKIDVALTAEGLVGVLVVDRAGEDSAAKIARKIFNRGLNIAVAVLGVEAKDVEGFDIGCYAAGLPGAGEARKYFLDKGKAKP